MKLQVPTSPALSQDTADVARKTYLSWGPAEREETPLNVVFII